MTKDKTWEKFMQENGWSQNDEGEWVHENGTKVSPKSAQLHKVAGSTPPPF